MSYNSLIILCRNSNSLDGMELDEYLTLRNTGIIAITYRGKRAVFEHSVSMTCIA